MSSRLCGGVVAHVILVSALGPNPSFFLFWGTFIQLGGLLGQGPGLGLGPGLDNFMNFSKLIQLSSVTHKNLNQREEKGMCGFIHKQLGCNCGRGYFNVKREKFRMSLSEKAN